MKKTKKLLSLLTALTITASAFASFVIPASAAVTPFSQNYEAADVAVDWESANTGRYVTRIAGDASNHYLEVVVADDDKGNPTNGNNGTTAETNSGYTGTVAEGEDFTMTFDLSLTGGNDQAGTTFQVKSSDGYILSLNQTGNASKSFMINGSEKQTIDYDGSPWYSFSLSRNGKITWLTVTDADGKTVFDQAPIKSGSDKGGITGLYFASGRYSANMKLDNIEIDSLQNGDVPSTKFYNVKINSTRYAKLTTENDDVYYADVNGVISIPLIQDGSTIEYTITKSGYEDETGSFTVDGADIEQDKPLTIIDEGTEESTIYVESDFGNANGAYGSVVASDRGGVPIALGDIALPDIATVSIDLNVNTNEKTQITWLLRNKSDKDVVGVQCSANGLVAFTGYTGSIANTNDQTGIIQYNIVGKYTNSVTLAEDYTGKHTIDFVFDLNNNAVTVRCGNVTDSLPLIEDAHTISNMIIGKHEKQATAYIEEVRVSEPNPNYVLVSGDAEFAKIEGKTVTRQYTASPVVMIPGETMLWTVTDAAGVSIDQNGLLSVTDAAEEGTVKITATSSASNEKKGEVEVNIKDVSETYTPTIVGPKVVEMNSSAQFSVTKIVDEYGDDVTDYLNPVWSIDGVPTTDSDVVFNNVSEAGDAVAISAYYKDGVLESVIWEDVTIPENATEFTYSAPEGSTVMLWNGIETMKPLADTQTAAKVVIPDDAVAAVSAKTGKLTTYDNDGDIILKVSIGGKVTECLVIVGQFVVTEDYTDGMTTVDVASIVANDAINGYQVTVADADGNMLAQEVVQATDDEVTLPDLSDVDGTPAKVEVAPVYEGVINTDYLIPAGSYNVTAVVNNGRRTDLYVNDQMIFNNINQGSDYYTVSRVVPATAEYTANDIVIAEGNARFNLRDDSSGGTTVTGVKFVRSPSIVNRVKKVYAIGDSLVANYYGALPEENTYQARTGWGQVLQNYLKNAEVTNLGNSGAWATGMLSDAFTNVAASGQPGDILVLESGYNDNKHISVEQMNNAVKAMVDGALARGMEVFVTNPNASAHDYKTVVVWGDNLKKFVEAEYKNNEHVHMVDLSAKSYNFMNSRYASLEDAERSEILSGKKDGNTVVSHGIYSNVGDTLHSTYNAANVWAAIVANEIYSVDATKDIVNTEYTYTFNDTKNNVDVNVLTVND